MRRTTIEAGLARAFAGDFASSSCRRSRSTSAETTHIAVNDAVATSSTLGRMVELGWSVGGEDLGTQPCDGVICATPSGSTAYNLSNGGPVLVWGLDAMAVTFVSPHSLHARPLVVPRGLDLVVRNETPRRHGEGDRRRPSRSASSRADGTVDVRLGPSARCSRLLPETTFFHRYRETLCFVASGSRTSS